MAVYWTHPDGTIWKLPPAEEPTAMEWLEVLTAELQQIQLLPTGALYMGVSRETAIEKLLLAIAHVERKAAQ